MKTSHIVVGIVVVVVLWYLWSNGDFATTNSAPNTPSPGYSTVPPTATPAVGEYSNGQPAVSPTGAATIPAAATPWVAGATASIAQPVTSRQTGTFQTATSWRQPTASTGGYGKTLTNATRKV